jgi:DNA-binding FadR family transcriptional regulator
MDAIRMRRPDAARFAMEQLIGTARMELSDALRAAKPSKGLD